MANNENKTRLTNANAEDFIATIADEQQRTDSKKLTKLMSETTGQPPKMWGSSIIGFGQYHYKSKSREGDWLTVGFSPRKGTLTLYLTYGIDTYQDYLNKLGRHKTGKGCLYIKQLSDVNMDVLKDLVAVAYKDMLDSSKNPNLG